MSPNNGGFLSRLSKKFPLPAQVTLLPRCQFFRQISINEMLVLSRIFVLLRSTVVWWYFILVEIMSKYGNTYEMFFRLVTKFTLITVQPKLLHILLTRFVGWYLGTYLKNFLQTKKYLPKIWNRKLFYASAEISLQRDQRILPLA